MNLLQDLQNKDIEHLCNVRAEKLAQLARQQLQEKDTSTIMGVTLVAVLCVFSIIVCCIIGWLKIIMARDANSTEPVSRLSAGQRVVNVLVREQQEFRNPSEL